MQFKSISILLLPKYKNNHCIHRTVKCNVLKWKAAFFDRNKALLMFIPGKRRSVTMALTFKARLTLMSAMKTSVSFEKSIVWSKILFRNKTLLKFFSGGLLLLAVQLFHLKARPSSRQLGHLDLTFIRALKAVVTSVISRVCVPLKFQNFQHPELGRAAGNTL